MFPSAHHPGGQPHPTLTTARHTSAHSPAAVAAAAAQVILTFTHLNCTLTTYVFTIPI